MLRGYIRTSKTGQSVDEQKVALTKAGITDFSDLGPVYLDDREGAIRSLIEGDTLVVSEPSRLGISGADVLLALEAIGLKGCSVMRADTLECIKWAPDTQRVISFANEADSTNKKLIAANARKARAATGNYGGKQEFDWTPAILRKLKKLIADGKTREEQAAALGCSRSTLQRKLSQMNSGSKKGTN